MNINVEKPKQSSPSFFRAAKSERPALRLGAITTSLNDMVEKAAGVTNRFLDHYVDHVDHNDDGLDRPEETRRRLAREEMNTKTKELMSDAQFRRMKAELEKTGAVTGAAAMQELNRKLTQSLTSDSAVTKSYGHMEVRQS
jgi:hypothetical protein